MGFSLTPIFGKAFSAPLEEGIIVPESGSSSLLTVRRIGDCRPNPVLAFSQVYFWLFQKSLVYSSPREKPARSARTKLPRNIHSRRLQLTFCSTIPGLCSPSLYPILRFLSLFSRGLFISYRPYRVRRRAHFSLHDPRNRARAGCLATTKMGSKPKCKDDVWCSLTHFV